MNDCCKAVLKEEWAEINRWKPHLHFCPDWDFLLIDKGETEFEYCHCFDKQRTKSTEKADFKE